MKTSPADLGILAKFFIPAFILCAVLAYLALRRIVVYFWNGRTRSLAKKKVEAAGQVQVPIAVPAVPAPTARKTDRFDQLSSEQKRIYMQAKDLVDQKMFVEAAKLFETINFQRKAIDTLESAGFIDEACAILLRMGAPYRAAVIYERNNLFLKAGEYYLQDGKLDLAARCYEKLAEKNFPYFRQAGDYFLQAGLIDSCLQAYSRLELKDEILRICLEHSKQEFLVRYLDLPHHAQSLLPQLTAPQLQDLAASLGPTPQSAMSLAHWTMYRPDEAMVLAVIAKLSASKDLAQIYWAQLDDNFCNFICGVLNTQSKPLPLESIHIHVEALQALGRTLFAEQLIALQNRSVPPPPPVGALAIGL